MTPAGDDLTLTVETAPAARDVEALGQGLTEHAWPFTYRAGFQPLAVFARDRAGVLVGGVHGHVNWTWLHVALFWIAAAERRRGLGSSLLRAIETAAIERGCTQAHLDTFSYRPAQCRGLQGVALPRPARPRAAQDRRRDLSARVGRRMAAPPGCCHGGAARRRATSSSSSAS